MIRTMFGIIAWSLVWTVRSDLIKIARLRLKVCIDGPLLMWSMSSVEFCNITSSKFRPELWMETMARDSDGIVNTNDRRERLYSRNFSFSHLRFLLCWSTSLAPPSCLFFFLYEGYIFFFYFFGFGFSPKISTLSFKFMSFCIDCLLLFEIDDVLSMFFVDLIGHVNIFMDKLFYFLNYFVLFWSLNFWNNKFHMLLFNGGWDLYVFQYFFGVMHRLEFCIPTWFDWQYVCVGYQNSEKEKKGLRRGKICLSWLLSLSPTPLHKTFSSTNQTLFITEPLQSS